jgi:hypothetical protein
VIIQLPVMDGLIAATAHEYDLIFITRNTKDFAKPGLSYIILGLKRSIYKLSPHL